MFIVDTLVFNRATPEPTKAIVKDFNPNQDVLVLARYLSVDEPLPDRRETLDQMTEGMPGALSGEQTGRGITIAANGAIIVLKGVKAKYIDLDSILLMSRSAASLALPFDIDAGISAFATSAMGVVVAIGPNADGNTEVHRPYATFDPWRGALLPFTFATDGAFLVR